MFRILTYIGLALLLPGLVALGYSIYHGPAVWTTDSLTFWGVPVSLFVFWIGLAHAGTLISAIFLALGVRLDRRTALLAEMSTLCCLVIAALYPLMHLGIIGNFYMVIPFLDARGAFANVRSPLVWDFCCIMVYGILSFLFFSIHLAGENESERNRSLVLANIRRPMAWILFPLVLWVHTVVSLDFATTFVPAWRGAFFPFYFIMGAIYSGLALVNLLLAAENYRVRILEKLMLVGSWFMMAFWLWNFVLKGDFSVAVLVFAGIIPQFMLVETFRESRAGYVLVYVSILVGMLLERIYLVSPSFDENLFSVLLVVDFGLLIFGIGLFMVLFFCARRLFAKNVEDDEMLMGDVDEFENAVEEKRKIILANYSFPPLTTPEFKRIRLPLMIGILVALIYVLWAVDNDGLENIEVSVANVIPIMWPLIAFVSGGILCAKPLWRLCGTKIRWTLVAVMVIFSALFGFVYVGHSSVPEENQKREVAAQTASVSVDDFSLLWMARCAQCHGIDGKFNSKFIREFYPVPQKLTMDRLDSLGMDSLVQVILHGRVNMSSYNDRLDESQARGLVQYMRLLAREARK